MAGWTYATLTTAIGNYTEVGTGVLTATIQINLLKMQNLECCVMFPSMRIENNNQEV